jgi:tetratricopeptide (TPR) repeat protein
LGLKEKYKTLISVASINDLSTDDALQHLAKLTDISFDLHKSEGCRQAIKLLDELQKRPLLVHQYAASHYYAANAWANLRQIERKGTDTSWDWEQDELDKEFIHLRKAVQADSEQQLIAEGACKIFTNLGNVLDHVGRFVEAIEYWERALLRMPTFAMARGNRGFCLTLYARQIYDQGHQIVFFKHAHGELKKALEGELHPGAKTQFEKFKIKIESMLPGELLNQDELLRVYPLGLTQHESDYRQWCLEHKLFLNPLNDLGLYSIAAQDVLSTPSIVVGVGDGPYYQGYYNQMKQEFVSARFLYYDGINADESHFSDKDVLLLNTLDYPSYSLAIEKVKAAYRIAYSLFDKIAYFLNHYLRLSIPERSVTFRTFWYESQSKKKGLRTLFHRYPNWPLRGLYWLSKDLYEDKPGFKDAIEPEARELAELRNHLEHKYLKLHDDLWSGPNDGLPDSGLKDTLAFSVYRKDFEARTLKLLKMARAALIYLSLSVHADEQMRAQKKPSGSITVPMSLDAYEDNWKI